MTMKLEDLAININRGSLRVADADDFRALTGKSLEQYIDEYRKGGNRQVHYFDELLDPEMRALVWVFARDESQRERVWEDADELWRAMESDIRRLTSDDFLSAAEKLAEQETAPAAARPKRTTAAQKRTTKRASTAS